MPGNRQMKRRQLLSAAGAGLAAGIAGCTGGGGQETTAPPDTTMGGGGQTGGRDWVVEPGDTGSEVHILTDYSNDAWQKIWDESLVPAFEDDLGLSNFKAEYVGFQGTGEERLTTLLQSGNAPESFTGGFDQIGDIFARGDSAATTPAVEQIIEGSGELVGEAFRYHGETFVVPHGKYTDTIHYRTDIIEQLGLEPPETLEQYLENAKTIDESDKVEARGATSPAVKAGQSENWFDLLLYQQGAHTFRWKTDEHNEPEVWFPKEEVLATLDYIKEMAKYSPDPTSVNWGSTLSFWAGGRVAQMYQLNGWAAGVAAQAGNTEIAKNTGIVPFPQKEGVESFAPVGAGDFDGHPALGMADNVPGLFKALVYMYEDPERAARYYTEAEPSRFIPAYTGIMETDAYQKADIFQEVPNLLDLNIKSRDEVAPKEVGSEEAVITPATTYADSFPIQPEMVNQVVVADRDPEKAYEDALSRWEKRLEEGKEQASDAYPT